MTAVGLVTVLALSACGSETEATTTTNAPTTTSTTTASTIPASTTTLTGESDVHAEINWFLTVMNGAELTELDYEARFSESFRQQVPFAEGFEPVLDQFRTGGPYAVVERTGTGSQGEAVIESSDGTRVRVLAELDDQGRFAGLLLQPEVPTLDDPPESLGEALDRLADLGTLGVTTAEVVDGECMAVEGVGAGEPVPIASVFKLYVLAALGEAIVDGDIAWDDELEIRDELKSVPTGILQDRAAGETVTVLEAAELMISISDNTATDHLIDLLGRETVESTMSAYGHTAPELNTPLLNTRELTALKVGPASGLYVQWLEGDEQARRDLLRQISDITPADLPIQEWSDPVHPDTVEWFASPNDLCTLAVRMGELTETVPEVAAILGMNPGIQASPGTWETIWFKGGSEPGLVTVWWVTEIQGRTFVTAGSVVNPEVAFDSEEAILLFAAARDLLAP
jgi:hypothetical protein